MTLPADERQRRLRSTALTYVQETTAGCPFHVDQRRFGVELEFTITDDDFMPVLGAAEKVWCECRQLPVVQELGSFQIEVNPPPEVLCEGAFRALHDTLTATIAAMKAPCTEAGGRLLPIGLAPRLPKALLDHPHFFAATDRFRASAEFSREHRQEARIRFRKGSPFTLTNGSAVAMINELHVHIEALSAREIGPLFEAAQDLTPLLAALGANSGCFEGERLSYLEHQVWLFAESEARPATRCGSERVGLYPHPFTGPLDYFHWISTFPLWANVDEEQPAAVCHAFEKNYCGWVRLRMEGSPQPSLRIELRVPSVQPTLRENVALAEWAVKAVVARAHSGALNLSTAERRRNLERCTRSGLDARVYWPRNGTVEEIPVVSAIDEIFDAIGGGEFMQLLLPRLRARLVPALRLANECERLGLRAGLDAYRSHFQWDEPYVQ